MPCSKHIAVAFASSAMSFAQALFRYKILMRTSLPVFSRFQGKASIAGSTAAASPLSRHFPFSVLRILGMSCPYRRLRPHASGVQAVLRFVRSYAFL